MNGNTLVYNVPTSCNHSFQVNGTRIAYIDSNGMTIGTSPVATQSYVTGLEYITSSPGVKLNMNSNSISFTNNGAGITWANNNSQIYDDGNLHINTDDSIYISAPTQFYVTTPTALFSGNVYMQSNLLASQSWVTSQFNNPTFTGSLIVTYTNASCYMLCQSLTGNN